MATDLIRENRLAMARLADGESGDTEHDHIFADDLLVQTLQLLVDPLGTDASMREDVLALIVAYKTLDKWYA